MSRPFFSSPRFPLLAAVALAALAAALLLLGRPVAAAAAALAVSGALAGLAASLQRRNAELSDTIDHKLAELSAACDRQERAEKELERQVEAMQACNDRLRSTKELLAIRKNNRGELLRIINASPLALVMIDDNLQHVISCNDTAVMMFAAPDKQQFLENFRRYLPDKQPDGRDTADFLAESIAACRRNGGGDFECEFRTHAGEKLPLWVAHRFMEVNGQRMRFTYLQDMRKIKRAQEIMRGRQEELERLFANLPVPMEILDSETQQCLFANQAFLDLCGLPDLEARRRLTPQDLTAEVQRDGRSGEELLKETHRALKERQSLTHPWTLKRDDGSLLETTAFSQAIRYQERDCFLTAFHNVTETVEDTNMLVNSVEHAWTVNSLRRRSLNNFRDKIRGPLAEIVTLAERAAAASAPEREECAAALRRHSAAVRELAQNCLDWDESAAPEAVIPDAAPLGEAGLAPGMAVPPPPAAAASPAPERATCAARVLLADDNAINRMSLGEMLRIRGIPCDEVTNGDEAVLAADSGAYDVILMDINMPGLQGDAATRIIRDHGHAMPIIALTSGATAADRERYAAAGMTDLVDKPVLIDDLVSLLREILPDAFAQAGRA